MGTIAVALAYEGLAPGLEVSWIEHDSRDDTDAFLSGTIVSCRIDPSTETMRYWIACDRKSCPCDAGGGAHVVHPEHFIVTPLLAGAVLADALF